MHWGNICVYMQVNFISATLTILSNKKNVSCINKAVNAIGIQFVSK